MSITPKDNPFAEENPEDKHTAPLDGPETDDEKADEWGDESFPSSDPPANY